VCGTQFITSAAVSFHALLSSLKVKLDIVKLN
jgi:hypothetical protein